MSPHTPNSKFFNIGAGLIEVMIALFVTAIGLLGLAALQGKAQRAELESYQRTQALILLQDMASRMRANRAEALQTQTASPYLTEVGYGSDFNDIESCSIPAEGTKQAQIDLSCWHIALIGKLEQKHTNLGNTNEDTGGIIGGHGCITKKTKSNEFNISIAWQGMTEVTQDYNHPCGNGIIQNNLRRTISIPVHFAEF